MKKRLFLLLLLSPYLSANSSCKNANILSGKLITDICWDCIFPLRIAGQDLRETDNPAPKEASKQAVCACQDDLGMLHPGIVTSFYEPKRLIEFQRTPGCSSVLNGTQLPFDKLNQGHHQRGGKRGAQGTFMHYHYYSFPLLSMLDMFTKHRCNADGYMDLDMMYLSELDPTWNNDELAFFTNPEAALVANPIATAACSADAISSSVGNPLNSMFWCAGSWGTLYPLSGSQYTMSGVVENTSLLKAKVLAGLHRRGLAHRTMGSDAMCEAKIEPRFIKSMYRYTLLHPIAETKQSHGTGESVFNWGIGKTLPGTGQDLIYTIWRWNDCCNTTGGL